MSYFLFPPPRTVAEVVPIHHLVIARMDSYCSVHVETFSWLPRNSRTLNTCENTSASLRTHPRMYSFGSNGAWRSPRRSGRVPLSVCGRISGKARRLEYAKSNIEAPFLDPSVIWSLTMARTFHYMIGQPTYGYSQECCDAFLASRTDVPLSVEIGPSLMSFVDPDRINHLCILELNDAWTCENALLQDEIEASQGVGRGLEKAVEQAEAGYGQSPSGRFFV
ncbi:hypothetical protein B0H13DRAFT_2345342 [Mycena leptocephala]|nr:hypothetical protein B0H13DRAFT_2345342 [Mycena leptocephala]